MEIAEPVVQIILRDNFIPIKPENHTWHKALNVNCIPIYKFLLNNRNLVVGFSTPWKQKIEKIFPVMDVDLKTNSMLLNLYYVSLFTTMTIFFSK